MDIVELNDEQIDNLFGLLQLKQSDVFYDLGCGTGKVVLEAVKKRNVQRSVGIEINSKFIGIAKQRLKKLSLPSEYENRIKFLQGDFVKRSEGCYFFDISDATAVYNSLSPRGNSIFYNHQFGKIPDIKIAKRDLPLVGYCPKAVSRKDLLCPFFLMLTPLEKYRIYSKKKWATIALNSKDAEIDDVYRYYSSLWKKNNHSEIPSVIIEELENLVQLYLPKD